MLTIASSLISATLPGTHYAQYQLRLDNVFLLLAQRLIITFVQLDLLEWPWSSSLSSNIFKFSLFPLYLRGDKWMRFTIDHIGLLH